MSSSIRQRLFDLAQKFGYTIVPNWRLGRHPQTVYLQKLFNHLAVDCVLDVGANQGQYRDFLREEVGFNGTIVSFEPIPQHVEAMRRRGGSDPRWLIEGCALGATSGTATFNVMASTTFSSFLSPTHTATKRFEASNEVRERIEVPVKTLDEVLPGIVQKTGVKSVYLKLDTQGFDLEVIKGAPQSLKNVRALQTEASVKPIYVGMPDFSVISSTLSAQGFEPSGIYPNNEGHFPLLIEFDFHMISTQFKDGQQAR
jgi:FkbM family methyltransferase